jgi:quercetin dioxygenase-like cupin family protein
MEMKKVHEDDRGEIYAIPLEKNKEITILVTNKGYARGGCIHHDNNENCIVIRGKIQYFKGDDHITLTEGNTVFIPRACPHFFISDTDSILMEWGATLKEKDEKHKPFRNIVLDINKARKKEKK